MASLWGDGWFYISALGFLGSGALFLYLLGQYRSAVEEADEGDAGSSFLESTSGGSLSAKPVIVELIPASVADPIVSQPKAKTMPDVAPVSMTSNATPDGAPMTTNVFSDGRQDGGALGCTGPELRRSDLTSSGGISPAVVYLKNIKSQMEKFDKEIAVLKGLSAQQAAQGELVLQRLSELADGLKTGDSPRSALPAAARSVELALETAPEQAPARESIESTPVKAVEPMPSAALPDDQKAAAPSVSVPSVQTRVVEVEADPAAVVVIEALSQAPITMPAPAPSLEPVVEPSQPRKGPVWPV